MDPVSTRARVVASGILSTGGLSLAGQPRATRPAPTPAKDALPTKVVDATLFPRNDAKRSVVRGTSYHVSPTGADAAAGTKEAPFRTVRRGLAAASAAAGNGV